MEKYKVTCTEDNQIFIHTFAFSKLYQKFQSLKSQKGRIILILGSPGTGKSSNIYHAVSLLDLYVYDVELKLKSENISQFQTYNEFLNVLIEELNVKTKKEAYNELSRFDIILLADNLLDSENSNNKIGLSHWLEHNRLKSILLYLIIIYEILKNLNNLRKINLVFHLTWSFKLKGKKYDILSDFSLLSLILKGIIKLFFEVIEIKYSEEETINIVKSHFEGIKESQIKPYIKKYGCRPRYILEAIEKNIITFNTSNSKINAIKPVCKPRKILK